MNATNAGQRDRLGLDALMCCDRPMVKVPARPEDEPFTHLWRCRTCGHVEPVDTDQPLEVCAECSAQLETEPDLRYDRPLCPDCAETADGGRSR